MKTSKLNQKGTLTINRYELNNNTIHSTLRLECMGNYYNLEGIEHFGFEIPKGEYMATFCHSPKFNEQLYLIDIPNRQGIRIHCGNHIKDTYGCILVGEYRYNNMICNSKEALNKLHSLAMYYDLKVIIKETYKR
jgi:hypothetical protein